MFAARRALLTLVLAKDDVPDYWAELGKIQASVGAYGDAYYAFTRAYELDRSNPQLLRALTELALRSGNLAVAQEHARELEVVAPGDPWIKLADGWAAFKESRYDDVLAIADTMLAERPMDPSAKVLKARALIGLNRAPQALQLLIDQIRAQPSDTGSLTLLARIYERQGDWPKAVGATRRLRELTPEDQDNSLRLIEASFRAGNAAEGRTTSLQLLRPDADPELVSRVLDLWSNFWPAPQRIRDARSLAAAAKDAQRKLIYAAFLSSAGSPADAVRLTAAAASLPVTAENAEANATFADALSRTGNVKGAKARFDAVLAFDPGNATALRGRSELALRTGNSKGAIDDAQKLVTVLPQSARDRLLLARAYSAAGEPRWADRVLWAAFHDIPADAQIYGALAASRKNNLEAMYELQGEFARQSDAKLSRGLF